MKFIPAIVFIASVSAFQARAQQVLTLENAKQMALEKNNQLKIARLNVDAAKVLKEGSKASAYPGIGAGVTGFYLGKPLNAILPEYGTAATLGVNQAIYNGGRIRLGQDAAQKELEIQQAQEIVSSSEVLLNVVRSYWTVAKLKEKLSLAIKYKSVLEAFLSDLNNSLQAGTVYKNDVLRVQVQLNTADLGVIRAKDDLTIAKLSFAQLIGSVDGISFDISDSVGGIELTERKNLLSAGDNRPEILLLNKALEQQRLQAKIIQADLKPTIGLSANGISGLGGKGINPNDANNHYLNTYYGLLSFSIPIWDWGATKEKVKAQNFRISAQQVQLEDTRQLISLEVQHDYLQLNESYQRIGLSTISVAQAEENLKLNKDRFAAGTILSKDLLEAENLWDQAKSDLIDAKVAYKINEAIFQKAIGEIK